MDIMHFTIEDESHAGQRLDKVLTALQDDLSRARIQALIGADAVHVNGEISTSASRKLRLGDAVSIEIPDLVAADPEPQDIPLDIVFEDSDMLVINKQAGLVVHPGAGNHDGTLVNALLHHCGDSLSGIGGVMRPGIVHRLDKETSGLMVVAKHDKAHQALAAQLQDRSLSRVYEALVLGVPTPIKGAVDMSIGRDPRQRQKMAVNVRNGKLAKTFYHVESNYGDRFARVCCTLESGRTHQIRVHMAAIKHALIGDPLYGPQVTAVQAGLRKLGMDNDAAIAQVLSFPRQALHARQISFVHPTTGERLSFSQLPPPDYAALIALFDAS